MKDDAPPPPKPPKKRKQLERAPDLWLAVWANDHNLPEVDRAKVQEERDRRKAAQPDRVVGILVDYEGATPSQLETVKQELAKARPTMIHHPWTGKSLNTACKATGAPVEVHRDVTSTTNPLREVVLASDRLIVAPRSRSESPVWDAYKYAKHRKLPITVVLMDGTIQQGDVA